MSNPGEIIEDDYDPDAAVDDAPDVEAERIAAMEAEASRMGWRPKEQYRGPPGGWRTAEEFLKRGQDILPIVRKDLAKERERTSKMEEEIRTLRQGYDEQKLVMDDLLKMARTANDNGYKRAMDELKAQKRVAAQEGDIAKVVLIDEQISEVAEARAAAPVQAERPKPAPSPEPKPKVTIDPAVEQFVADNPWFNTDAVLHKAMEAEHMLLLQDAPGMSLEDNLRQAKEIVMQRYPRKFGIREEEPEEEEMPEKRPKPRASSVSAPTPPANSRRAATTGIASIEDPQERAVAQQAFARAKRQMADLTESEWFAVYENPGVDSDTMRGNRAKKGK